MLTPSSIGRKEFHLKEIAFDQPENQARLEILYRDQEHGLVDETISFDIPDGYRPLRESEA